MARRPAWRGRQIIVSKYHQPCFDKALPVTRSKQRIDRILDAAAQLLEEQGLDGYTVHRVATLADLGAATVYRHFACRDAITEALIDREAATLLGVLCEMQAEADPQRRLTRLIRAHIAHRRRRPHLAKILDFEEWRLRGATLSDRDPILPFVQAVISDDRQLACRSAELAGDILAIVRGMAASPDGTSEQLERRIRGAVAGYLDSCSAGPIV